MSMLCGERKEDFVLMVVSNATDYMGGSDEQGRPVDDKKLPNSRDWRVYSYSVGAQATSADSTTVVQLVLSD